MVLVWGVMFSRVVCTIGNSTYSFGNRAKKIMMIMI